MDRSLKERVIGASVLVALAVWLIPWVLDGPVPDTGSGTAQAPAAERSAPLRTQTIRLENRQGASAQGGAPDIPGSPPPQDSEVLAGVANEVSSHPQPEGAAAPVPGRGAAGERVDAPSGNAAMVPADVSRGDGNPPVPAVSGPGSSAIPAVEPGSGWLVQVGSFSGEENARRLADRLEEMGYSVGLFPHRSGAGLMYRVRVGPESGREGAEEMASSLRAQDFRADVVRGD